MRLPEEFRERTKRYASAVVRVYVQLPRSRKEVEVLGHQLLRSGTSVAAHTWPVAVQEGDESQLWIELLREDCGIDGGDIERLNVETNELVAIFATMANKTKRTQE